MGRARYHDEDVAALAGRSRPRSSVPAHAGLMAVSFGATSPAAAGSEIESGG